MKKFKRILASLLVLCMMVGLVPASAMPVEAATGETTYVLACSDFQNKSGDSAGANTVTSIANKIKSSGYGTMDGFLFAGDHSQSMSTSATTSGKNALQKAVQDIYGTSMHEVYVQGNHDPDDTVGSVCSNSGDNDPASGAYGVYVINEKDYPWGYGANTTSLKNTTQETANALDEYLDEKVVEGYDKPIFVVTHLPLHYTSRTSSQSDGIYAKYLYDVLDEAGDKGLNIIFMFGHNHSSTYDDYLGGSAIYLAEGSNITIAKEGSTSEYYTDELSFTYMNSGYVGYSGSRADSAMTMSVFEITDNEVLVNRYDASGLHNLKAAGVGSGYPSADTSTVSSGAKITLTTPVADGTEGDSGTGDDNTGSGDSGSTNGSNVYVLDTDGIDVGEDYLIVSSGSDGTGSALTNASGSSTGTDVTISNGKIEIDNENLLWNFSGSENGTVQNGSTGYYIYPSSTNGEDPVLRNASCDLLFAHKGNGEYTIQRDSSYSDYYVNSSNDWTYSSSETSVYLYKKTSGGTSGGSTVTPEGGDWVTISSGIGGTIYKLDTDGVSTGEDYLIVSTNANGTAQALRNNNGSVASAEVTISNGQIITSDTDIVWTYDSSKYLSNGSHSFYLSYNNATSFLSSSEKRALSITSNSAGEGAYTVKRDRSSYNYYLNYSNGSWTNGNSADDIYFFVKSGTEAAGTAEYAKLDGELAYTVSRGASTEVALTAVKNGINVLTSANADGSNPTTLDDSNTDIKWELASNYDGTTAGEYAVKIYYKDKYLGTAKVIVPEVTINGITVNPASGVVNEGASDSALVGATITVDVKDDEGEDYTIPVTVGMLSGEFTTSSAGTYEGLTVSYNGFKYEGFTLTVKEKVVNNYPSYPNEGAVKVDKSATGIEFQKTGVAKVELSASGVPMNQGVDVMLVLDTSSSMGMQGSLDSGKRIDVLKDCVNALIKNLKEERADGSASNIDIAIVHFNGYTGNKNTNYIGSTARSTTTLGGQLTDGWVDIHTLSDTWATTNIPDDCSGTNYDHGLQQAYDMLAQKQVDDPGRKQFVLFMSDGAPFQYNGVNSNSLNSDWENWILGSYTQAAVEELAHVNNPEFYYGNNNGNGQKHRVAEAIKGAPANKYQIVTYSDTSSSGTTKLEEVSGLGATMYSVGLALEGTNMPTDVAGQEAILKTIASNEDVFYSVTSAAGLQGAFDDFAGAVLYAADNAVFEDALGADYNIQLASTSKRLVDGKEFKLDPAPTMEVREYTIWTRAELEDANGNLSEENAKKVGTRKTDTNGDYIYNTLEKVSFNAAGTEAYTGDDTANIMKDNVICAKTFWYNNGTTSVMIDADGDATTGTDGKEFELKPETFLWKVGTIKSKEIALSYYVYLDDSLEGDASAGSYATNEYAILTYDNYLGNPCKKETVSPQMAWLSANVSYAYYLVNRDGKPVNANGEEVTFANREIVVHPTKYGEIKLNSIEDVENLTIASTGILDEGNYALFDYDAEYNLLVNSDATGGWEITVGDNRPATTYVTDFSDELSFTNATTSTSEEDNYDYTHTTVWFAVVWEPKAIEDTVVVDYGLPVDVHVMENDFFGDFGTLEGVATGVVTEDGNVKTNEITTEDAEGTFGGVEVIKPETGANAHNSVIRYTLDKDNSMQMNSKEVFTYSVDYTNTKLHTNNGYYYGQLTVIPATTIYYEDDFVTYDSYTWNNGWSLSDDSLWEKVTDDTYVEDEVITQDEDRPGDINYAFDMVIDANNLYGYDSHYTECSEYSLGSAMKATVDYDNYAQASFTFYGTGFDIISLTSNMTGAILVNVEKESNGTWESFDKYTVDTYYGYKQIAGDADKNGTVEEGELIWVVDPEAENSLYQVPVIKMADKEYGHYRVTINATYDEIFDHVDPSNEEGTYDFYLDAIRIYDPANGGAADAVIKDAYKADGEDYPEFTELRNKIISVATFGNITEGTTESVPGVVFIDGKAATYDVSDYKNYGPNNELYLQHGQAIAFDLNAEEKAGKELSTIQLAVKSVGGTGEVEVYAVDDKGNKTACLDETIATATDLYYDITDLNGKTVVIKNAGVSSDATISITNIKTTYADAATATRAIARAASENLLTVTREGVRAALLSLCENPEINSVTSDKESYVVKDTVNATIKTNAATEYITVNGEKITGFTEKDGERIWTYSVKTTKVGSVTLKVVAYNAMNEVSNEEVKTVSVKKFAPKTFKIALNKKTVVVGEKIKATVTTSTDVAYVTINGKKITKYTSNNAKGTRTWTLEVKATKSGKMTFKAVAYNKNESGSNSISATATAKKFAPKTFKVTASKYTVKKGQKYTITIKTSTDVKYVTVNGKKITKFTTNSAKTVRTFKITYTAKTTGKNTVKAIAYNNNGSASNAKTITVTVKK